MEKVIVEKVDKIRKIRKCLVIDNQGTDESLGVGDSRVEIAVFDNPGEMMEDFNNRTRQRFLAELSVRWIVGGEGSVFCTALDLWNCCGGQFGEFNERELSVMIKERGLSFKGELSEEFGRIKDDFHNAWMEALKVRGRMSGRRVDFREFRFESDDIGCRLANSERGDYLVEFGEEKRLYFNFDWKIGVGLIMRWEDRDDINILWDWRDM